jgi:hypothetical protein
MRKYLLILLLLTTLVFTSIAYLKVNYVKPNNENIPSHLTLGTISTANSITLNTSDSAIATASPQLPSMLRSSNGTLLVFWIASGNIYSQMSSDNGTSFTKLDGTGGITTIQTIDTGVSEASVSLDSSDNIYVTYLYGISLRYTQLTYSSGHWTTGSDNLIGGLRLKGGVSLYSASTVFWSASMISSGKFQVLANGVLSYLSNAITDQYTPYPTLHLLGNNPIMVYMGIVPSRSIRFVKYNGSSWSTEATVVSISGSSNQFSTAKDGSNNIHLVYVDNGIKYKKYNGSNWTSADATLSSDANDVDPKVSIDSDGNPIVIWSKYISATDNDIVYKRFNGTSWDTNPKDLVNNGLLNRHISTPESMNSSTLKYIWTEGTGSPYNVKFNSTYLPSYKAHITSSTYTVSGTDISNIPFNTSKATFLSNLTKEDSNITFDDSKISDPVVTGDSIISTAEDGTTSITYNISVNADPDIALVGLDKAYLTENLIKGDNPDLNNVTKPLTNPLPVVGPNGSTFTWISDKPSVLSSNGITINRPLYSSTNENIILTVTITKGLASTSKEFGIVVLKLPNTDLSSNNYTIDLSSKVIEQIPLGTSKTDFLSAIVKDDPNIVIDASNVSDPVKSGDTITIKDQYGNILGVYDISVLATAPDSSSSSSQSSTNTSSTSSTSSTVSSTTSSSGSSLPTSTTSSSTSSITEILIPTNSTASNLSLEDSSTQRNRIIVAVMYFLSLLVLVSVWAYRKARRSE